jgi:hypothetical protein
MRATSAPGRTGASARARDADEQVAVGELAAKVCGIVEGMREIQAAAVAAHTPEVEAIITSASRDKHRIEHLLDHLLSFCGDDAALALFKRLCRYYWDIDPTATAAQVYAYRDWFGEEPERDEPAASRGPSR